ncbi:MAG: NADP oxidoreductase, partial [Candidatus Rokubacteria bacterium]|nr:NADP oxidoreductase [Candidatus Rokubacteria bacterium]
DIAAGLVFRSVGYRGVAIAGLPFDEGSGTVPNRGGRVIDAGTGAPMAGLYVAGWIKRGPAGVSGTNKPDAAETVACMLEDAAQGRVREPAHPDAEAVETLVRQRQPGYVSYADWQRLDEVEVTRGRALGRPRVKLTRVKEMLAALGR